MSRILQETLVSSAELAKSIPPSRGKAVNPSTIGRWIARGVKGPDGQRIRLEAFRLGGRYVTSREAFARFLGAQQTTTDAEHQADPRTVGQRQRASEAAGAELAAAGI
jgi:hypothetical protein